MDTKQKEMSSVEENSDAWKKYIQRWYISKYHPSGLNGRDESTTIKFCDYIAKKTYNCDRWFFYKECNYWIIGDKENWDDKLMFGLEESVPISKYLMEQNLSLLDEKILSKMCDIYVYRFWNK